MNDYYEQAVVGDNVETEYIHMILPETPDYIWEHKQNIREVEWSEIRDDLE